MILDFEVYQISWVLLQYVFLVYLFKRRTDIKCEDHLYMEENNGFLVKNARITRNALEFL